LGRFKDRVRQIRPEELRAGHHQEAKSISRRSRSLHRLGSVFVSVGD
jgi:hypothetical protein